MPELKEKALERYTSVKGSDPELLVSGSDDFTLFLWKPGVSNKPVSRMTGIIWAGLCDAVLCMISLLDQVISS